MKGGVRYSITEENYVRIMERFGQGTYLPIPSQKRGICTTDALISVLWYTDGIRNRLWEQYIHNKVIDTDCEQRILTASADELATCFFQLSGARVATLLTPVNCGGGGCSSSSSSSNLKFSSGLPISKPLLRTPSAKLSTFDVEITLPDGTPIPELETGELCSMIYQVFRERKNIKGEEPASERIYTKRSFATWDDETMTLLRRAFEQAGVTDVEISNDPPRDKEIVAVYTTLKTGQQSDHVVAMCKINGDWHFMDNNVGYSLPMTNEKLERFTRLSSNIDGFIKILQISEELYYVGDRIYMSVYDFANPDVPFFKTGVRVNEEPVLKKGKVDWVEDLRRRIYVYRTTPAPVRQLQRPRDATNAGFDELNRKKQIPDPEPVRIYTLEVTKPPLDGDYNVTVENLGDGTYLIHSKESSVDGLRLQETEDREPEYRLNGTSMEIYVPPSRLNPNAPEFIPKKQKGGMIAVLNRTSIRNGLTQVPLPTPSQKSDICATDALAACIWYTDKVRQPFWKWIFQGNESVTIDTNEEINQLRDTSTSEEVVRGWLRTTAARVGTILSRRDILVPGPFNTLRRAESARDIETLTSSSTSTMTDALPAQVAPEGEKCARFYHLYNRRIADISGTVAEISALKSYRVAVDSFPRMMNEAIAMVGASELFECGINPLPESLLIPGSPIMPFGAIPFAIIFSVSKTEKGKGHTVAISRVNGQWFFIDNEGGIAYPLSRQDLNFNQTFRIVYNVFRTQLQFTLFLGNEPISPLYTKAEPLDRDHGIETVVWHEFAFERSRRIYIYQRPQPEIEELSQKFEQLELGKEPTPKLSSLESLAKSTLSRRKKGGRRKTYRNRKINAKNKDKKAE